MQQISPGSCAFEIRRSLQFKWYEPLIQTIMGIDLHLTFQTMNNYLLSLPIDHVISLCPIIKPKYLIIANGNWVCWHFFVGAYEYRSLHKCFIFYLFYNRGQFAKRKYHFKSQGSSQPPLIIEIKIFLELKPKYTIYL